MVLVLGAKTPNFLRQARTSGICPLLDGEFPRHKTTHGRCQLYERAADVSKMVRSCGCTVPETGWEPNYHKTLESDS